MRPLEHVIDDKQTIHGKIKSKQHQQKLSIIAINYGMCGRISTQNQTVEIIVVSITQNSQLSDAACN